MKIGIVTFQRADNQGALLQCYALYSYLKEFESETEVIDYRNNVIENRYKMFPCLRKITSTCKRWCKSIMNYPTLKKRHENFSRLREMIGFSSSVTAAELKQGSCDYDLIITGSDQVWNTKITGGFDDIYYLDFPGGFVKGSYAASIGSTDNNDFRNKNFGNALSQFDMISVREKDAVDFVSEAAGKEVFQCVDPTLLLGREKWDIIAEKAEVNLPEKYILLYYVQENSELKKIAEKLAKERGIPVVCFNRSDKIDCRVIHNAAAGPMEFVKLIRNAETVVTSSFHATAFSCIFNKDVHIIAHSLTGSRVVSLTELFGIEHRIYASYADFEKKYNSAEKLGYSQDKFEVQLENSKEYLRRLMKLADKV